MAGTRCAARGARHRLSSGRLGRLAAWRADVLRVGLTGGIGAGKSEVSKRLAAQGAVVIDADLIAREVVAPGTDGLTAVIEAFGTGVLGPDGALDRARLGDVVFGDKQKLETLNSIVHPRVGARMARAGADRGTRLGCRARRAAHRRERAGRVPTTWSWS